MTKHNRRLFIALFGLGAAISAPALAQEDDFDDFDPSQYVEAGEALKAYATNKVLGQSPTQLISLGYDFQGSATLTAAGVGDFAEESVDWGSGQGFRFVSNVPVLSRNDILINWGVQFVQLGYQPTNDATLQNPLAANLTNNSLKWANTTATIFKPLNEKRWILIQASAELNGDYSFGNLPSLSNMRFPIAALYGWKPSEKLMWGVGASRTYLGGGLNYLPIIYYYHTFKNDKMGIEAVFPSRVAFRYRTSSRNLFMLGYSVEGATYALSNFNATAGADAVNPDDNMELMRSEIRLGLSWQRGLNDFIWIGAQAGYRINYSYDADPGDFYRGFGAVNLMNNGLTNTAYAQVTLSMVSP